MAPTAAGAATFRLEGGNGDAVVLVHGYTGHPGHFRMLGDLLRRRGYTVVAPLLAGHRGSVEEMARVGWRDWLVSVEAAAESVACHRRVHLVGLSLGGLLSILAAGPTAAASLVTINSPVPLRPTRAYLAPLARPCPSPLAGRSGPSDPAERARPPDPALADLGSAPARPSAAAVAELVEPIGRPWVAAGRLRRPALVAQSRDDTTVRPVSGRLL